MKFPYHGSFSERSKHAQNDNSAHPGGVRLHGWPMHRVCNAARLSQWLLAKVHILARWAILPELFGPSKKSQSEAFSILHPMVDLSTSFVDVLVLTSPYINRQGGQVWRSGPQVAVWIKLHTGVFGSAQ